MIKKIDVLITHKHYSLENGIFTLKIDVGNYDLTSKTITAKFNPSKVETGALEVVDGAIQIPIYSSMVQFGINYIQLNFRWDENKLEQSGKLVWIIDSSLETESPAQEDVDIITYLVGIATEAKKDADDLVEVVQGKLDNGEFIGPIGPQGERGIQGPQGIQGEKGDKGDTGEQGLQGIQGEKGDKGDKGDRGEQGIQGIQGPKGDKGEQGIQGPKGEQGVKGDTGEVSLAQLNVVDSKVTSLNEDYVAHKEEYTQLNIGNRLTNLEEAKIKKYGVRRVLGATTPVLERLGDAVGKVANADTDLTKHNVVQNDFDKIFPWSHIRNCIITASGRIIYQGEAGYSEAIGDWMVEIPEFYWKRTNDGIHLEEWVSPYPVGGYTKSEKFYIARFKTSEQDDAHVSKPNSFPKVTLSRAGFRTKAMEKGAGWQLEDLLGNYILNLLYRVEFAHLNSQLILGSGVTSVRYAEDDLAQIAEDNTNRVVLFTANASNYNVGEAISIGTARGNMEGGQYRTILAINDLGNGTKELVFDGTPINVLSTYKVYMAGQVSGKTLGLLSSSGTAIGIDNRSSITYRGIEDIFGNVWEWVDGVLINDHRGYVCVDPGKYTDTVTADYKALSYENAKSNNYAGELGFDSNYPFAEFAVDVTGGSTTKYCDYYYQNTGLRAPCVGGYFACSVIAGLRYWTLGTSPGSATFGVGARLLKTP